MFTVVTAVSFPMINRDILMRWEGNDMLELSSSFACQSIFICQREEKLRFGTAFALILKKSIQNKPRHA